MPSTPSQSIRVNATTDGDNDLITAHATRGIEVYGAALNVNAAGVVLLKDNQSSPVTYCSFEFVDGGGIVLPIGSDPWFTVPPGFKLVANTAAGVDLLGMLVYRQNRQGRH